MRPTAPEGALPATASPESQTNAEGARATATLAGDARMKRVRLGDWTTPSGNNVVAVYCPASDGRPAAVQMQWDSPPPLSPGDEAYYLATIQPALLARVREYTERVGRTLVLTLMPAGDERP
jgi:hypothetical protein